MASIIVERRFPTTFFFLVKPGATVRGVHRPELPPSVEAAPHRRNKTVLVILGIVQLFGRFNSFRPRLRNFHPLLFENVRAIEAHLGVPVRRQAIARTLGIRWHSIKRADGFWYIGKIIIAPC